MYLRPTDFDRSMTPPTYEDYTVGWVCAITNEETAAKAMLDDVHEPLPQKRNDSNVYILGRIYKHNIVIACLPAGKLGTHSAAITATNMFRTFTSLRFCLMVGVGGGLPNDGNEARLGDVVVSTPRPKQNAVVQHDFGKTTDDGFVRTHSLNSPPRVLLNAINRVRAEHSLGNYGYLHHMSNVSKSVHQALSIPQTLEDRTDRNFGPGTPRVFYGTIVSGNQLVANAAVRNQLRKDLEALCIEMEAAGLMDDFRCLVVRGICDNSDSSKNKDWQGRAALAAAAVGKELLTFIEPEEAVITPQLNTVKPSDPDQPGQECRTQPAPPTTSQFTNSFFLVNRQILESSSVALGRLVVSTRSPWDGYCPHTATLEDTDIGISLEPRVQELLEATRGMSVHQKFITMLSRLLEDEDLDSVINSVSSAEKTYVLPNSSVRFEEACQNPHVRKWLENLIRYGIEVYMVIGLHTISTPSTRRMTEKSQVAECFSAPTLITAGEVIVAIQYRKVKYHWFWRSSVDKAFLEHSNVWEPAFITKGSEAERDSEVVQATLQETVSASDFTDEGEIFDVNGQVIVL